MGPYQYTEESYLGYTVISGMPQPASDLTEEMTGRLPRAYGVIDGMKVDGDTVNLIVMVNQEGENDSLQAKANVKAVLKAFHDRTALAYVSGGITDLANSLGKVGSAFITTYTGLLKIYQSFDSEQKEAVREAIGPGKLSPYNELARLRPG